MIPCAEGAIALVDGKARVVQEEVCDGVGVCLPACPTGALTIETREAPAFDAQAAEAHLQGRRPEYATQHCFRCKVGEDHAMLIPCRTKGKTMWVCTRCLPSLIHG